MSVHEAAIWASESYRKASRYDERKVFFKNVHWTGGAVRRKWYFCTYPGMYINFDMILSLLNETINYILKEEEGRDATIPEPLVQGPILGQWKER